MNQHPHDHVRITHIGGPTALIEIGRLRLLTDPAFDPAGSQYEFGTHISTKTTSPARDVTEIGPIDAVLLSHDHHIDNLDRSGRAFLSEARQVLTTPAGAQRLGAGVQGVATWKTVELQGADGQRVVVTATPARHGPAEIADAIGDVTGWIVTWDGQRRGALYISGDTVLFDELETIGQRYQISVALLHFGAARVKKYGAAHLTFTGAEGAEFAQLIGDALIVPIHYEGWAHLSEGQAEIEQAFAAVGIEHRLRFLPFGHPVLIDV